MVENRPVVEGGLARERNIEALKVYHGPSLSVVCEESMGDCLLWNERGRLVGLILEAKTPFPFSCHFNQRTDPVCVSTAAPGCGGRSVVWMCL